MATSDSVDVAVEIIDQFSDDLTELEARLEKIDGKKLKVDLDIDAGDIESVKTRLKQLEKDLDSILDIDVKDYTQAMAMKANLSRDMTSTLSFRSRGFDGDLPGASGIGPPSIARTQRAIDDLDFSGASTGDLASAEFLDNIKSATRSARSLEGPQSDFLDFRFRERDIDMSQFTTSRGGGSYPWSRKQRVKRAVGNIPSMLGGLLKNDSPGGYQSNPFKKMGQALKSAIPSMHTWHSLIAAIIPMLIALAGAALGAAAAVGALAAAGAAMVGLGVLGYGDSTTEAINNFKKDLGKAKKEIAGILRPVGNTFQPFVAQLLSGLPSAVSKLVEPLQRLDEVGYDTFFLDALDGTADWLAELVGLASDLAPEIQAIGAALGEAFGNGIINLLRWSVNELYNNWDAYARLVGILGSVILVLFNVSKAVSFAITVFKPLFDIAAAVSDLFGNRIMAALLAVIGAMVALGFVMSWVAGLMATIKGLAIAQAFWAAVTAAGSLTGALAVVGQALGYIITELLAINALTGGILLLGGLVAGFAAYNALGPSGGDGGPNGPGGVGGGPAPPASGAGSGYGGGGGGNIIINGDVRRKEYNKLMDKHPEMWREQSEIQDETER